MSAAASVDTPTSPPNVCLRTLDPVIIVGVAVVVAVEVLSVIHALRFPWVCAAWATFVLGWIAFRFRSRDRQKPIVKDRESATWTAVAYTAVILTCVAITFVLALVAAPAMSDALSYHMARVAHWIQNGSVAFYPTNIDRQLWSGPWAEYVILQLQLLTGTDRFATLVQWGAFAGSILVSLGIARTLGCDRNRQLFAALFVATIPMAIAQSSGAQNDLVASFWLLIVIAVTLETNRIEPFDASLRRAALIGAALGVAILTKGTNYIFAFPFVLLFIVRSWRALKGTRTRYLSVVALSALSVNATHYARNVELYQWPLGPRGNDGVINAAFGPRAILSNLSRDASVHIGTSRDTSNHLSKRINDYENRGILRFHNWLGISLNDTRTTWNRIPFSVRFQSRDEIDAGSPFHLALIVVGLSLVLFRRGSRLQTDYAICLAGEILLFSIAFRWEPFIARLQLPGFIAAAPLVAFAIPRRPKWLVAAVAFVLAVQAWPALVNNPARPLLGVRSGIAGVPRERRYFMEYPLDESRYIGAASFLAKSHCHRIGLVTAWSDPEYAFWAVAKPRLGAFRIDHVDVTNASKALLSSTPPGICAVLTLNDYPGELRHPSEPGFAVAWRDGHVSVQLPIYK